ncbi:hypothetical protein BaRGS_00016860, partial [Batillaria attramentaria]
GLTFVTGASGAPVITQGRLDRFQQEGPGGGIFFSPQAGIVPEPVSAQSSIEGHTAPAEVSKSRNIRQGSFLPDESPRS